MVKNNNCLLFIGEYAEFNIIVEHFLFCIIFHNNNNTIQANTITSKKFDKELQYVAPILEKSGINYIPYKEIAPKDYDYVISIYGQTPKRLVDNSFSKKIFICAQQSTKELEELGFSTSRIIPCTLLCDSQFSIDFYNSLKNNPPSILSNQCFGRYTYFSLGTEFYSPFVNITLSGSDLLKVAESPKEYLQAPIKYYKNENIKGKDTPVALLADDIKLNLTHYTKFEDFEKVWNTRVKRINFDNIVIALQAYSFEDADRFKNLTYSKKICFLEEKESSFSIDLNEFNEKIIKVTYSNFKKLLAETYREGMPEYDFNSVVNHFAMRYFPLYSLDEFINSGELKSYNFDVENELSAYIRDVVWG
ncbi:DUF1919 domain-containing protein [Succinivibrio dextrinosolvens]|uniref:DUF1919 domain-containing protein n=1 Tax=Succinivibrio dextrinosolvens TaxID=83771 RepID=UPI0024785A23|nr:DUF1919 domain-containing protein [Succinivibrio dextrinosolvens]